MREVGVGVGIGVRVRVGIRARGRVRKEINVFCVFENLPRPKTQSQLTLRVRQTHSRLEEPPGIAE